MYLTPRVNAKVDMNGCTNVPRMESSTPIYATCYLKQVEQKEAKIKVDQFSFVLTAKLPFKVSI